MAPQVNSFGEVREGVRAARESGRRAWLVTLVAVEDSAWRRPGARALFLEDGRRFGSVAGVCIDAALHRVLLESKDDRSRLHRFDERLKLGCPGALHILSENWASPAAQLFLESLELAWAQAEALAVATVWQETPGATLQLGRAVECGGDVPASGTTDLAGAARALLQGASPKAEYVAHSLVESWPRRTRVLLAMDASEAGPFVRQMQLLGWQCALWAAGMERVEGVDGPVEPGEDAARLDALLRSFQPVAVVSMTRRLSLDERVLRASLGLSGVAYLGLVGSRKRCALVVDALIQAEERLASQLERLHAPCGLDLSGEAPEAVALSVVAEIQAVLGQKAAPVASLGGRAGALHARTASPRGR
ncbi:MAG: XdhC family protein [Opitutales bacterium]